MAGPTTPKRAATKRAPAKAAPKPLTAPSSALDAPDISDIPKNLQFESTAYTEAEREARPTVDLAYSVKHPISGDVLQTLRLTARRPNDGFLQLIGLDFMTAANSMAEAQACLQFVYGAFDPVVRSTLRRKMYDPDDSFELEHMIEIATTLLKEWGVKIDRDS